MSTKNNRLILKAGTVFDSHSGKLNENTTIVIVGRKIAWIGDDGSFEKEKGDKILAVTGKTILPGLIETHVHLDATGNPQYERELMRTKTHMWPYIALHHAQQHLVSGFTCVRDCGANPDWSPSLRRILDQGILAGPRLVVSDRFLGQPGTQEFIGPEMYLNYFKENYDIRSGPEGVMDAVRERKLYGSDFIKTATTGGVLHGIESKIDVSFWTDEELQAMATEAHRIGMHIACHANGNEGIYRATKFGIDTIEHGSLMT
ncbi:MAG: amidohydrolase family protein, partial [Candidatus Heimdallarchaeota archaeon]